MRFLFRLFLLVILSGVLLVAAGGYFGLADQPLVASQRPLSHEDIARARAIVKQNDPRGLPAGARRTISVNRNDLELATNYLIQTTVGGRARVALGDHRLGLRATVQLPLLPRMAFLNVEATLRTLGGKAELEALRIGDLSMPTALAEKALKLALEMLDDRKQVGVLIDAVEEVRIQPGELQLTYVWNPALIDQARDTLLTHTDREALRYYVDELSRLQGAGIGRSGPLIELLGPMFDAAAERSRSGDPVAENTALLTVLGTWASGQSLDRLVPGSRQPGRFRLKLDNRRDYAQHFLSSAALAARGDSILSDAVGLFKEIADTDGGSGFSFTDIAADRAGTRFGALATDSRAQAIRVQQLVANGVTDNQLIPPISDLPEHLDGNAFRSRFGAIGSPEYRRIMNDIERRIERLALYQE
jgi:hypothetical protein